MPKYTEYLMIKKTVQIQDVKNVPKLVVFDCTQLVFNVRNLFLNLCFFLRHFMKKLR